MKEINARKNRVCKIFRRQPADESYELLHEVEDHVNEEIDAICHYKCLEWCASLNGNKIIGDLYQDLQKISGEKSALA